MRGDFGNVRADQRSRALVGNQFLRMMFLARRRLTGRRNLRRHRRPCLPVRRFSSSRGRPSRRAGNGLVCRGRTRNSRGRKCWSAPTRTSSRLRELRQMGPTSLLCPMVPSVCLGGFLQIWILVVELCCQPCRVLQRGLPIRRCGRRRGRRFITSVSAA